ncbi:uncharacterized protein F5891DRAFT_960726 [Suillus fuscotomentosus]|uniref:Uncharacterized protein n=1 Tax=Suillus fuscotomentosus TaxID=1912939 RepID=A0AAD4DVU0_9AGAM|nr:uncharacterized protein F5891DRAFT_960726 [Suillus fuscotomentosus]KAG1895015.1 hypothetical protein F5891DRAFT_960726 [Suillus fuscotomentosus]
MGGGPFTSFCAVHSHRVPSLGGYDSDSTYRHHIIIFTIGCFSGTVFGGLHCLGWNALFQGHTEKILWCAASLVIVSIPVSIVLLASYIHWLHDLDDLRNDIAQSALLASLFVYIVARVTLIVLILMSFGSLPPGIYRTVAWTEFIPHL